MLGTENGSSLCPSPLCSLRMGKLWGPTAQATQGPGSRMVEARPGPHHPLKRKNRRRCRVWVGVCCVCLGARLVVWSVWPNPASSLHRSQMSQLIHVRAPHGSFHEESWTCHGCASPGPCDGYVTTLLALTDRALYQLLCSGDDNQHLNRPEAEKA